MTYSEVFARSISDPAGFWGEQAALVDWINKPQQVLDDSRPPFYRWFPDATLNTCYNALDRHVAKGRAEQAALIYDSPVTGTQRTYTYARLLEEVAAFAGVLRGLGVQQGDRVVVYMPMIPEAVVAMLACARIGAVHSVVFGGFAAHELAVRIDDARPTVVVAASCGVEPTRVVEYKPLLDRALEQAEHQPAAVVVKQRPQAEAEMQEGRDVDWDVAMRAGRTDPAECVEVRATDPLYVLYTSGHDRAGPRASCATTAVTPSRWRGPCRTCTTSTPARPWWAASDVGWVVGHSYIVYAPLISGATTVLYEGKPVGTPDAGAFWRVVAEHRVQGAVHRADRDPRDQEGGPARGAARRARPVLAAHAVPRGGAARPGHLRVGDREARRPGRRQLVADRDRLADRLQPARPGADADQARLAVRAGARVRRAGARPDGRGGRGRDGGGDLPPAAAAAGDAADPVGRRRALRVVVPLDLRGLLRLRATAATSTRTATSS